MSVDKKVYALAEHFVSNVVPHPEPDVTDANYVPIVWALAEQIQQCIEDWIEYEQQPGRMLS